MSEIYLLLMVGSLFFPVVLSFDNKVHFVSFWKWTFLAGFIVAIPYLIWDQFFTQNNFWGFNPNYLLGYKIGELPVEEVSFFLVIPFACVFIYSCLKVYMQGYSLHSFNRIFYLTLLIYCLFLLSNGIDKWYTLSAIPIGILITVFSWLNEEKYTFLPLAFTFSILPFLVVNGILTGSFLQSPIVWYSDDAISGFRIFTIPMEDLIYGWGLIALNIFVFEFLISKSSRTDVVEKIV